MREFFIDFFTSYGRFIVFIHIISAVIWIGGMIVVKFVVAPTMAKITDIKIRLSRTLEIMQRLLNFAMIFMILLAITGTFMSLGLDFKHSTPSLYILIHIKEAVWTLMALNFIYIYRKRNSAQRQFIKGDLESSAESIFTISNYLLPLNIFLGFVAIYFGVILRGL
jgi:uncharacterized membrane protein